MAKPSHGRTVRFSKIYIRQTVPLEFHQSTTTVRREGVKKRKVRFYGVRTVWFVCYRARTELHFFTPARMQPTTNGVLLFLLSGKHVRDRACLIKTFR